MSEMSLHIRKKGWATCYLDVQIIDFRDGMVFGTVRKLKTGKIIDPFYWAELTDEWEYVLSADDILMGKYK